MNQKCSKLQNCLLASLLAALLCTFTSRALGMAAPPAHLKLCEQWWTHRTYSLHVNSESSELWGKKWTSKASNLWQVRIYLKWINLNAKGCLGSTRTTQSGRCVGSLKAKRRDLLLERLPRRELKAASVLVWITRNPCVLPSRSHAHSTIRQIWNYLQSQRLGNDPALHHCHEGVPGQVWRRTPGRPDDLRGLWR